MKGLEKEKAHRPVLFILREGNLHLSVRLLQRRSNRSHWWHTRICMEQREGKDEPHSAALVLRFGDLSMDSAAFSFRHSRLNRKSSQILLTSHIYPSLYLSIFISHTSRYSYLISIDLYISYLSIFISHISRYSYLISIDLYISYIYRSLYLISIDLYISYL
jgi:hypothetical protein